MSLSIVSALVSSNALKRLFLPTRSERRTAGTGALHSRNRTETQRGALVCSQICPRRAQAEPNTPPQVWDALDFVYDVERFRNLSQ